MKNSFKDNLKISQFYFQNIFRKKIFLITFLVVYILILTCAITTILILKNKSKNNPNYNIDFGTIAATFISFLDIIFIIWTLLTTSKLFYSTKSSNNEIMLISRSFLRKNLIINKFFVFFILGVFYSIFTYVFKIFIFLTVKNDLQHYQYWYYLSFLINFLIYFFFGSFFMLLKLKWSTKISFSILIFLTLLPQPLYSVVSLIPTKISSFYEDIKSFNKREWLLSENILKINENKKISLEIVPNDTKTEKNVFSKQEENRIFSAGNNFYLLSFLIKFLNPIPWLLFSVQIDRYSNFLNNVDPNDSFNPNQINWQNYPNDFFYLKKINKKKILKGPDFEKNYYSLDEVFEKLRINDFEKFKKFWEEFINNSKNNESSNFENIKNNFVNHLEKNNFSKILEDKNLFVEILIFLYRNYPESNFIKTFISGILDNNNEIDLNGKKINISELDNNNSKKIKIFRSVNEFFIYKESSININHVLIIFIISLSFFFTIATYFIYIKKDYF
ncbi:ABC transporter permease [Mycoplasmopsis cricetuli]|uniref:ABC transporter permease n=1 Tax=Mycoplasmopsis cricetuli TaxID=171283 RepID=UPI00046E790B|nr:ABC transporter permease [Mycoplasmopsis cricetuli]